MKLEKKLNVSAERFYNGVIKIIEEDLKNINYRTEDDFELTEGFTYSKRINFSGNQIKVQTVINKLIPNREIESSVHSSRGVHIINYTIKSIDENNCIVIYEESFEGNNIFGNLNHKFMEFILRKRLQKNLNLHLTNIVNSL